MLKNLLKNGGRAVCLIKPQFEAGKDRVGKKGVVRDISVHLDVVRELTDFMVSCGYSVLGLEYSPIKGPEGNIEYLAFIELNDSPAMADDISVENVVNASHEAL